MRSRTDSAPAEQSRPGMFPLPRLTDALRVKFNLACAATNKAFDDSTDREELLGEAEIAAMQLLSAVLYIHARDRVRPASGPPARGQQVRQLAETRAAVSALASHLRNPTIALLAGIWAAGRGPLGNDAPTSDDVARWRAFALGDPATTLEDVVRTRKPQADAELIDVVFDVRRQRRHSELFGLLGEEPELRSPRLAYAVACYHAITNRREPALRALACAIADPVNRAWAPHDPCLSRLRTEQGWTRLFPPPPSPPID